MPGRRSRGCLGLVLAALLTGCASAPPLRFGEVARPYRGERARWCPRAGVELVRAELPGPEDSGAPPLLLLHPWATHMGVWADVAPVLAQRRRVLLVDLPGHGKSGKPPGEYPVARLAVAVAELLRAEGLPPVDVAGNSLGGAVAIELALRAPARVSRLVLIGAPGGRPVAEPLVRLALLGTRASVLRTLDEVSYRLSWWVVTPTMPPLARALRDTSLALRGSAEWPAHARALAASFRAVARYAPPLERLQVPTLVVAGADDRVVWSSSTESMARRIPGAHLRTLLECGHMPELDCPAPLVAVMEEFLGRPAGLSPR